MIIRNITRSTLLFVVTLLFTACNHHGRVSEESNTIYATIAPIKYIVEQITGDDFSVEVLVPAGASPESFEPTPKQYIALNESQFIFSTGLINFETALLERIEKQENIVNLSRNISLIEGACSHNHSHKSSAHSHGVDPHIWTSPRELKTIARNAYEAIIERYPDSTKYTTAYKQLQHKIEQLDEECRVRCNASSARAFIIYHPALTYYARAYGIEQIAMESNGKEPSAKHIANIIEQAKSKQVKSLMYQSEYPRSVVDVLAEDTRLTPLEINPLAENPIEFILSVTDAITTN
ncbi:MAG: zinc ABC transporter substrate-binding protein [Alistipes sp.]|nr:zinc ABC transporter substrate-binding protein [Alistipes sp.]